MDKKTELTNGFMFPEYSVNPKWPLTEYEELYTNNES